VLTVAQSKSKRQRELARAHYERQQARRHHHHNRRRRQQWIVIITVGAIIAAIGLGWAVHAMTSPAAEVASKATATPKPTTTPPPKVKVGENKAVVAGCKDVTITVNGTPPTFTAPTSVLQPGTAATATLATNCGPIEFALDTKAAPKTSNAFAFLAGKGYYNNTACHRLTTTGIYVLQCGDPTGSGSGDVGYQLDDENLPKAGKDQTGLYPAGSVAMAEGGTGKAGAQFFICYKDMQLPPNYTIFGHVTKGLDTLLKIAKAGSTPVGDGVPNQAVVIARATVSTS
jgi:peptidyl-prolyl cis-trans isomerase B (cyclophilin B)